jgi:SAM-dependent methyltransferase
MKRILRFWIARRLLRAYREKKYRWDSNSRIGRDGFDRQHGTDTTRIVQTRDRSGRLVHWYETASATAIASAIEAIGVDASTATFIDLGCGKGKPLLIAAGYPFQRIMGVDVDQACLAVAKRNVEICGFSNRIELTAADATEFVFPSGPLLVYLYNPFPGHVLRVVLERLATHLASTPDLVALIYMHPRCLELVESTGLFRRVFDIPGVVSQYERAVGFLSGGAGK